MMQPHRGLWSLVGWFLPRCTLAAWNNILEAADENSVLFSASIGNGYFSTDTKNVEMLWGPQGTNDCPPDTADFDLETCQQLLNKVGGTSAGDFSQNSEGDPKGCWMTGLTISFNSHPDGSNADGDKWRLCKRTEGEVFAYIAGVYNGVAAEPDAADDDISHRAGVPAPVVYGPRGASTAALDLEHAVYVRKTQLADDPDVTFEQRIYAHRAKKSLMVCEYRGTWSDERRAVTIQIQRPDLENGVPDMDHEVKYKMLKGVEVAIWIGRTRMSEGDTPTVTVAIASVAPKEFVVEKGQWGSLFAAYRTSLDCDDPEKCAMEDLEQAIQSGSDDDSSATEPESQLFSEHKQAWAELWRSGIDIEGRLDVQQTVKSSMYYILSSLREDSAYSIGPAGLGQGYRGHVFWDTETWMFPPLLVWYPSLAQKVLDYRVERIPAAEKKAQSYDPPFSGAMFAWESAASGLETCPNSAPTGQLEQHISADIAFAVRQYYYMSRNMTWLETSGLPLLSGIADFYVSKAEADAKANQPTKYHIDKVIPPDEYQDKGVRDSVYTNFIVKKSLEFATIAADLVGGKRKEDWTRVADGLVLLFDEKTGRHREYDGYRWGQQVKQADVVLLSYPLGMKMDPSTQLADLDYYANATDPDGPAMTWGMFSTAYLAVGNPDKAAQYFNKSFALNMRDEFRVWSETKTFGTTNFLTGAGSFLQAIMFGYFGLRIEPESLEIRPNMIPGATASTLRGIHYVGRILSVNCSGDLAILTLDEGEPLSIRTEDGIEASLEVGSPFSLYLGSKVTIFERAEIIMRSEVLPSQVGIHSTRGSNLCAAAVLAGLAIAVTMSVINRRRYAAHELLTAHAPGEDDVEDSLLSWHAP